MNKRICPACLKPITSNIGSTSAIQEGIDGCVVWHTECAPNPLKGLNNDFYSG